MDIFTHHICIKVSDLASSKAFYQAALGFSETATVRHAPDIISCFMTAPDEGLQLQLLKLPQMAAGQTGYGHLGMKTDDIRRSFAFHKQLGCVSAEILEQPHQYGYFIKDPDGYETELIQVKNGSK